MTSARPLRRLLAGVAATLVAATVAVAVPASPAAAAACPAGGGVTVVVQRPGVTQVDCVAAGGSALSVLQRAGHSTAGTGSDGNAFVCRIDGYPGPESEDCVDTPPGSAYWKISVSPGGNGSWSASQKGATAFGPKNGDWVGFAFPSATPSVSPSAPAAPAPAQPAPVAPAPSGGGSGSGSGSGQGTTAPSAGPSAAPGASPTAAPGAEPTTDPSADPSAEATATAADERDDETRAASSSTDGGGSPWALALAVLAIGGVGAAAFVVNRRRRSDV